MLDHEIPGADEPGQSTVSSRTMELVVSALLMAVATLVMWDSSRLGMGWAFDGPEAGYFPFYVGLIMFVSSFYTFVSNLRVTTLGTTNFVGKTQGKLVLQVLVPAAVFVFLIGYLGIYVAAAVFIAFFMWWLGAYPVRKIVPVAVLVPMALFILFEIWFLVPLPKGPLETALGF